MYCWKRCYKLMWIWQTGKLPYGNEELRRRCGFWGALSRDFKLTLLWSMFAATVSSLGLWYSSPRTANASSSASKQSEMEFETTLPLEDPGMTVVDFWRREAFVGIILPSYPFNLKRSEDIGWPITRSDENRVTGMPQEVPVLPCLEVIVVLLCFFWTHCAFGNQIDY